jgi:hypothetical protein
MHFDQAALSLAVRSSIPHSRQGAGKVRKLLRQSEEIGSHDASDGNRA